MNLNKRDLSSVASCRTHWAPSTHRSQWSVREDHALVTCSWKWRVRCRDIPEKPGSLWCDDQQEWRWRPRPLCCRFRQFLQAENGLKNRIETSSSSRELACQRRLYGERGRGRDRQPRPTTVTTVNNEDDLELEFDDSIQSLTEYTDDWKKAVKEAAEETLPKMAEHKQASGEQDLRTNQKAVRQERQNAPK